MTLDAKDIERWVALSEVPQHPNLYFLEPTASRITLYSQQVRALRLIHALAEQQRLTSNDRLAVIGAGAAGLSAAAAASLVGVNVHLYEKATDILPLQSGSPRFLHPHVYEWPSLGALRTDAYLPLLGWTAERGSTVRDNLTAAFEALIAGTQRKLSRNMSWTLVSLEREHDEWLLKFRDEKQEPQSRTFSNVILAIGFGDEQICGASPLVDYWRHPGPPSGQVEYTKTSYFISGSGDGGLTDALAVLIDKFEHLKFTSEFLDLTVGGELAEVVLDAEVSFASKAELRPEFEAMVLPVLRKRGIVDLVAKALRKDRTVMFNAEVHLAKGKASLLNQVMTLALIEAAKNGDALQFSSGEVIDVEKNGEMFNVKGPLVGGHSLPPFHHVILRHGPNKADRFAPAAAAFRDYRAHHQNLIEAVPSLGEPPQLHPQTFEYFDSLITDVTSDPGVRATRSEAASHRSTTLLLSWEAGRRQVVQQGAKCLLDVVRELDKLDEPWTIMVAASPDELIAYMPIINRSILAGAGILKVQSTGGHRSKWHAVNAAFKGPPHFQSAYHVRQMPSVESLLDALDEILLRHLDRRLESVVQQGHCDQIGPVHSSIADALLPTWRIWRSRLEADPTLRRGFLQLLFQVELAGTDRWNGDHASLPNLASALVLMLATHEGEQLAPAKCSPGNIAFGATGIGLGSGCASIGVHNIADVGDPRQWNVDALVLSQAREEMFQTDDLITDGGLVPTSFSRAKRVAPAVIPNTRKWRNLITRDLTDWRTGVEHEFARWRKRQQESLERV